MRITMLRQVKTKVNKNPCHRNVVWTLFAKSSEVRLDRKKVVAENKHNDEQKPTEAQ